MTPLQLAKDSQCQREVRAVIFAQLVRDGDMSGVSLVWKRIRAGLGAGSIDIEHFYLYGWEAVHDSCNKYTLILSHGKERRGLLT